MLETCNALQYSLLYCKLFSQKVAYSTIPLFRIPRFPESLSADHELCLSSPDTVVWLLMTHESIFPLISLLMINFCQCC